jgi:hypothetical protein
VTGVFTRNVAMLPLSKLTDMDYKRTIPGYLLGYGSFRLETAGQNQAVELLRKIPEPGGTYRHVQNLIFGRGNQDVILIDVKPRPGAEKRTKFITRKGRSPFGEERYETGFLPEDE